MIDREVSLVVSTANDLSNNLGSLPVKVGEITGVLDTVAQKLHSLKRKVTELELEFCPVLLIILSLCFFCFFMNLFFSLANKVSISTALCL